MSSVCGRNESTGLEGLGLMGKQQTRAQAFIKGQTIDRTWTYSLRYMSRALSTGSQFFQNGASEVVGTPQTMTSHEIDNTRASRSNRRPWPRIATYRGNKH